MTFASQIPFGPVPSPRQLQWHTLEMYAFVHFSINTFTDKEWGYGDEPASAFRPTDFDADEIVATFAEIGMKGLVLTCKHHDGFCLWPSAYTEHSVKYSPWQNGQGDMVLDFSNACARHGLKFGVYLSPWDRNHADYGKPEYLTYYRNQLRELLTNYGPIFEVWFDGANGGDGYYGGAREKRSIDNSTYYDWPNTTSIVRELQPEACMFSDGGPDIRWVGNESGFAGDPCWGALHAENTWPGHGDPKQLNRGDRDGTVWLPAEVDVSVRRGWFFHESEQIKSVSHLVRIYFESVGRGANLILNIPPDRRGRLNKNDVTVLRSWHQHLARAFDTNLAPTLAGPYWMPGADENAELVIRLEKPATFNVVRLREHLPLGQRVDSFALDFWTGAEWSEFAAATSIGAQRLVSTSEITTGSVRFRVTGSAAPPAISEFSLFLMPSLEQGPEIRRDRDGFVILRPSRDKVTLRYTVDGVDPTATSPAFTSPFPLLAGGTIKAREFSESGATTATFAHSPRRWTVLSATPGPDTAPPVHAIDEDPGTWWVANLANGDAEIVLDLGEPLSITGFTFLPRQDGQIVGTPNRYALFVGNEPDSWSQPVKSGEFSNIQANPVLQFVPLESAVTTRFVRFSVLSVLDQGSYSVVAGLGLISGKLEN